MSVSLFLNKNISASSIVAEQVREILHKINVQVFDFENYPNKVDFYCSIGGDGTILQLIHRATYLNTPIIGINLGGLGFLAEISIETLEKSLTAILEGEYTLNRRIILQANPPQGGHFYAANDVVIHRGLNRHIVDIAVHVGGRYINTFSGDGLIIATPTGSTAYSLAAGGPILTPDMSAFILTPIAGHTISNRPIVLSSTQEINIEYLNKYEPLEVTFDGLETITLAPHEILTLTLAPSTFGLVSLEGSDFFSTLRSKLGWAGASRIYRKKGLVI